MSTARGIEANRCHPPERSPAPTEGAGDAFTQRPSTIQTGAQSNVMDVVAIRIEPERLAQLTKGIDAHVELIANDDGCYRCVIVELDRVGLTSATERTRRSDTSGASTNGRSTKPPRAFDPNNLPIIRYVKYPGKACAECGAEVPRGSSCRWNPDTKDLFCNLCKPV